MKIAVAILFVAVLAPAANLALRTNWLRTDLPVAERDALVERGKQTSFAEISPILLEVLVKHRPMFGHYHHSGRKPWNSDQPKNGHRNYVMAEIVWAHHMRQSNDPARARVLLQLYQTNEHPYAQNLLVDSMTNDHWIPEMESVVAKKLDDTIQGTRPESGTHAGISKEGNNHGSHRIR